MSDIKLPRVSPSIVHDVDRSHPPAPATPASVKPSDAAGLVDRLAHAVHTDAPAPVDAPPSSPPSEHVEAARTVAEAAKTAAKSHEAAETVATGLLGLRGVFDLGLEGRSRFDLRGLGAGLELVRGHLRAGFGLGEKPVTTDPNVLGPAIAALEDRLEALDGDGVRDAVDARPRAGEIQALQTEIARLTSWLPAGAPSPKGPMSAVAEALAKQSLARVAARGVADARIDVAIAARGDNASTGIGKSPADRALADAVAAYERSIAELGLAQKALPQDAPVALRKSPALPEPKALSSDRLDTVVKLLARRAELDANRRNMLAAQAQATSAGDSSAAAKFAAEAAHLGALLAQLNTKISTELAGLYAENDADPLDDASAWPADARIAASAYKLAGRLSLRAHAHL